ASAEFRVLNPFGQIPVLIDGETVLADSNGIMVYLVRRYAPESGWLPETPEAAAAVQRWLSIAAGDIAFGPARARAITQWRFDGDLGFAQRVAARLFAFMEQHLADRSFLAADCPTLADLACCDYIAHAPEGGLSLDAYPNVRAWLGRVAAIPGFQPLPDPPPAGA
ncbi:MAG TPA: glutathione binding-like protein, partial [Caulobacteraceae bacterium]